MRVAHVVVDVPTRSIDTHFDYLAETPEAASVGMCVLVRLAGRPVVGHVVGSAQESAYGDLAPVEAVLGGPYFDDAAVRTARWVSDEYVCPLSEALRLFLPPGGVPKAVRDARSGEWTLRGAGTRAVDDRWAELTEHGAAFEPRKGATLQRAILDALRAGPVRVPELAADLGAVDAALKRLVAEEAVAVRLRRRIRGSARTSAGKPAPHRLTSSQAEAVRRIAAAVEAASRGDGGTVVVDGITGSGKTEVYMRAIEDVLRDGGGTIVLVPEISLTPQTVGRFRARFGDAVAVLHSRLSAGERFDQWDLARSGQARVVVGARSALFAPVADLRLVVIDEEHEASYKQASAPRYHARDVAAKLCAERGAALVLGSATPSFETLRVVADGTADRVELAERPAGDGLPRVTVVDMTAEFAGGNRAMFSQPLSSALSETRERGTKAVLLLNRRGFASFLLCRECGHVPGCPSCSTSLTYHEVGARLVCHHCGHSISAPSCCPECASPYLRRFGAGTQRVEAEIERLFPGMPVVRMDADTTRGKGGHERRLAEFEALDCGVLLGTQMIAKGLDYPDVTLVGVIDADTALRLPDFRAAERTWQMLEQVSGRAGRGEAGGEVVVQTYWPDHPAVAAAASHRRDAFVTAEMAQRRDLGYPPFGRLVNLLATGEAFDAVRQRASALAADLAGRVPASWRVLGPAPAPLARLQRLHRWHVLLKAPAGAPVSAPVRESLAACRRPAGVTVAVDVDPLDLA